MRSTLPTSMREHIRSLFFFSSRRRHTRYIGDWSSDVCSSDLIAAAAIYQRDQHLLHKTCHGQRRFLTLASPLPFRATPSARCGTKPSQTFCGFAGGAILAAQPSLIADLIED